MKSRHRSFVSLQEGGLTCSKTKAMVHRRVNFLVTSKSAVEGNTQKVRKARKYGVKVVKVDYLVACQREKKKLPLDEYIIPKEPKGSDDEEEAYENDKMVSEVEKDESPKKSAKKAGKVNKRAVKDESESNEKKSKKKTKKTRYANDDDGSNSE